MYNIFGSVSKMVWKISSVDLIKKHVDMQPVQRFDCDLVDYLDFLTQPDPAIDEPFVKDVLFFVLFSSQFFGFKPNVVL